MPENPELTIEHVLSKIMLLATVFAMIPLLSVINAFLFWLPWTFFEVGTTFFDFLPTPWQHPSILQLWCLIWCLTNLKTLIAPTKS